MEANGVHIYIVPKQTERGGDFYKLFINRDEKLDLTEYLNSIEDIDQLESVVQQVDETFKGAGGIILKRGEPIASSTVYSASDGEISLDSEEQNEYLKWLELEAKSEELYQKRKQDMQEFLQKQTEIDTKLDMIQEEKRKITEKMKAVLNPDMQQGRGGM